MTFLSSLKTVALEPVAANKPDSKADKRKRFIGYVNEQLAHFQDNKAMCKRTRIVLGPDNKPLLDSAGKEQKKEVEVAIVPTYRISEDGKQLDFSPKYGSKFLLAATKSADGKKKEKQEYWRVGAPSTFPKFVANLIKAIEAGEFDELLEKASLRVKKPK